MLPALRPAKNRAGLLRGDSNEPDVCYLPVRSAGFHAGIADGVSPRQVVRLWRSMFCLLFAPLGIVAGVQFAAVFHAPEPGFAFQVALPAKAAIVAKNMSVPTPRSALRLNSQAEWRVEQGTRFSLRGWFGFQAHGQ